MRYLAALAIACVLTAFLFWAGAKIAILVSGPEREANDYTVGQRFDLCGYQVDSRSAIAGYDLEEWQDERCRRLTEFDRCVLACLEGAGTIEIAEACQPDCVKRSPRSARPPIPLRP
ncbi:hypothetical protein K2X89_06055 [Myxococcota bacterium]|nr:hypothetical protein [Myxococcota bacterium]